MPSLFSTRKAVLSVGTRVLKRLKAIVLMKSLAGIFRFFIPAKKKQPASRNATCKKQRNWVALKKKDGGCEKMVRSFGQMLFLRRLQTRKSGWLVMVK